jgi:hypothetical protein
MEADMQRWFVAFLAVVASAAWMAQPATAGCMGTTIGNITYYDFNGGARATASRFGDTTFYDFNDGTRGTAQRFGATTFYDFNDGTRGTANTFGGTTFYSGSAFGQ